MRSARADVVKQYVRTSRHEESTRLKECFATACELWDENSADAHTAVLLFEEEAIALVEPLLTEAGETWHREVAGRRFLLTAAFAACASTDMSRELYRDISARLQEAHTLAPVPRLNYGPETQPGMSQEL